jgi:Site-specific recombinase XerD
LIDNLIGKEREFIIEKSDRLEILQFVLKNDMIDLSSVQREIEMKKREYYLSLHKNKIWQGKNGKWYTYLPDENNELIQKKRNFEEDLKEMIIEFFKAKESEPIFKEVFLDWVDEKLELNEICKGTYDRYINDYKRFFKGSELEKTKFNRISEDELDIFIRKTIVDKKLTQKAYSNLRTLILGTFKHAKKKKYTVISISSFIKDLELSRNVFRKNIKNKEDQIFLEDEIPLVTTYLKENGTILNLGLLLAFQTGIRTGELSALKFSDAKGKMLHIQRQEIKYKNPVTNKCTHEIKEFPKSDAGNRYVIITDSAIATIERVKLLNPNSEFMFAVNGKRILTNSYNDGIARVCKELNIARKSMHKIRRTYGTTLLDNNVDDSVIMEQMGHSDISTTKKFYYYSNKNQKSKEAQIERAISI